MASRKDYYEILGIRGDATEEEIEKAYQRLARTYQIDPPRGHKAGKSRFKEISEAYEILSNKEKRERYDRSGRELPPTDFFWEYGFEEGNEEEEEFVLEGFEDVFKRYFGGGEQMASPKPQKGKNLHCTVKLKFKEAIQGAVAKVKVLREIPCPRCSGNGMNPESPRKICEECGGGRLIQIGLPPSAFSQVCPRCHGQGKISVQLCGVCSGTGRMAEDEVVPIEVPGGVSDGCRIYLMGMGQMGKNGGPRGELVAKVEVQNHPYFQRKGADLLVEVPLIFWEAALGAEIKIPTLEGSTVLEVPPGVQNGEQVRLPGKGFPYFHGRGRGDQVVSFKVITMPRELNERSKEILGELKRLNPQNPRKGCGWRFR